MLALAYGYGWIPVYLWGQVLVFQPGSSVGLQIEETLGPLLTAVVIVGVEL